MLTIHLLCCAICAPIASATPPLTFQDDQNKRYAPPRREPAVTAGCGSLTRLRLSCMWPTAGSPPQRNGGNHRAAPPQRKGGRAGGGALTTGCRHQRTSRPSRALCVWLRQFRLGLVDGRGQGGELGLLIQVGGGRAAAAAASGRIGRRRVPLWWPCGLGGPAAARADDGGGLALTPFSQSTCQLAHSLDVHCAKYALRSGRGVGGGIALQACRGV